MTGQGRAFQRGEIAIASSALLVLLQKVGGALMRASGRELTHMPGATSSGPTVLLAHGSLEDVQGTNVKKQPSGTFVIWCMSGKIKTQRLTACGICPGLCMDADSTVRNVRRC